MTWPLANSFRPFPSRERPETESKVAQAFLPALSFEGPVRVCHTPRLHKQRNTVQINIRKRLLASVCPLGTVKHDILTVKEAGKDVAFQHNQQQGANHSPSRDSQSAWTKEGRPCGIWGRQGWDNHPPGTLSGKALRKVCRGPSCLLQQPSRKPRGAHVA